ncbi:GPI mannosyltransferase 1 [Ophiocordyceps camponoti-floridani]|uniref:GPI mannosyltransferase 1 n=1 Tax=Ophiocordyceps camponoti-floridani TaxID=2030778 RepID=A0A8H4QA91_9HYPO|nr:GPI mannosyltransferase 1 [Ophiocordyceps camponoti-floridani]
MIISPISHPLSEPWPLLTPSSAPPLFLTATALRLGLLAYGTWQDTHSTVKYTDIDYHVFTDAARSLHAGHTSGPYARETYRYTPLLAWLLLPTTTVFATGKLIFIAADVVAGWLVVRLLGWRVADGHGYAFAALWLWNPMVAAISSRGSCEALLAVLTLALLWAVEMRRVGLAGFLLGLAVHFKIYPFIYAPAIIWWMDDENMGRHDPSVLLDPSPSARLARFFTWERIRLAIVSLATFMSLNLLMYSLYGTPFLVHTYLHHVTRIDHRHNFSPYNILLYQTSAEPPSGSSLRVESLAFAPQLLLSCVLIPLVVAKKDLAASMMAQTFAFVTFNKVCTSQYFLWYIIFLPLVLPGSSFLRKPALGLAALGLWVASQAAWLHQAYQLEFLGRSTFFPGLWLASLAFFLVNCWILAIIISDGAQAGPRRATACKAHIE